MASLMSAKMATRPMLAVAAKPARQIARKVVVCKAEQQLNTQKLALPVATAVASVMLSGAFFPEEALAASSGGRAGGSSGFAARKSSRQQQTTTTTTSTTIVNNTYVAPAPVYAPPVYGGFGFGGFSIMPTFVVPVPLGGFGAILGIFFMLAMLGAVFNVVRSMSETSSSSTTTTTTTTKKYDSWDD